MGATTPNSSAICSSSTPALCTASATRRRRSFCSFWKFCSTSSSMAFFESSNSDLKLSSGRVNSPVAPS